jgi:hypothetical protein
MFGSDDEDQRPEVRATQVVCLFVCLFSRVPQGRVTVYCRNYSHSHTVIYYRMLHVILISADTIARSFRFGPESTRGPIVATRHLVLSGPR